MKFLGMFVGEKNYMGRPNKFLSKDSIYGNWRVLNGEEIRGTKGERRYLCVCVCGKIVSVRKASLVSGKSSDCGCSRIEAMIVRQTKHNLTKSPTYYSWEAMNTRCNKRNHKEYTNYGGAGIKVCDRWNSSLEGTFSNFLEDMGVRPDNTTLNRRHGSKIYSKDTCEWVSLGMQSFDQKLSKDNTSGRTGVTKLADNKFLARITVEVKIIRLGLFDNLEAASAARAESEIKHYGFSKE